MKDTLAGVELLEGPRGAVRKWQVSAKEGRVLFLFLSGKTGKLAPRWKINELLLLFAYIVQIFFVSNKTYF